MILFIWLYMISIIDSFIIFFVDYLQLNIRRFNILVALVVEETFAATTVQSAFDYQRKPGGHGSDKEGALDNGNSRNGNKNKNLKMLSALIQMKT